MEKIIRNEDSENLGLIASDYFFNEIKDISNRQDKVFVGLSYGDSTRDFYNGIVEIKDFLEKEYWNKIVFCLVDEKIIDKDSKDLNYNKLKLEFLDKLIESNLITQSQIINVDLKSSKIDVDYSNLIKKIDVAILGVGEDGHIASLFPEHDSIDNESENYILVSNSPKQPKNRISMSKKMFENLECSFIFFVSDEKKDAYKRFNKQASTIKRCPAKLSQLSKRNYILTTIKT